jgi:hypothetical protein
MKITILIGHPRELHGVCDYSIRGEADLLLPTKEPAFRFPLPREGNVLQAAFFRNSKGNMSRISNCGVVKDNVCFVPEDEFGTGHQETWHHLRSCVKRADPTCLIVSRDPGANVKTPTVVVPAHFERHLSSNGNEQRFIRVKFEERSEGVHIVGVADNMWHISQRASNGIADATFCSNEAAPPKDSSLDVRQPEPPAAVGSESTRIFDLELEESPADTGAKEAEALRCAEGGHSNKCASLNAKKDNANADGPWSSPEFNGAWSIQQQVKVEGNAHKTQGHVKDKTEKASKPVSWRQHFFGKSEKDRLLEEFCDALDDSDDSWLFEPLDKATFWKISEILTRLSNTGHGYGLRVASSIYGKFLDRKDKQVDILHFACACKVFFCQKGISVYYQRDTVASCIQKAIVKMDLNSSLSVLRGTPGMCYVPNQYILEEALQLCLQTLKLLPAWVKQNCRGTVARASTGLSPNVVNRIICVRSLCSEGMKRLRASSANHAKSFQEWDGAWPDLVSLIEPIPVFRFLENGVDSFSTFLDQATLSTLAFSLTRLCDDLLATLRFLENAQCVFRGRNAPISVNAWFERRLCDFVTDQTNAPTLLELMTKVAFVQDDAARKKNLVRRIVLSHAYSHQQGFHSLNKVFCLLGDHHVLNHTTKDSCSNTLLDGLKSDGWNVPHTHRILELLDLPLGRCLCTERGLEAVRCYIQRMKQNCSINFYKKTNFLVRWSAHLVLLNIYNQKEEDFLFNILREMLHQDGNWASSISTLVTIASDAPNAFCMNLAPDSAFKLFNQKSLFPEVEVGRILISAPEELYNKLTKLKLATPGAFCSFVTLCIVKSLELSRPSPEATFELFKTAQWHTPGRQSAPPNNNSSDSAVLLQDNQDSARPDENDPQDVTHPTNHELKSGGAAALTQTRESSGLCPGLDKTEATLIQSATAPARDIVENPFTFNESDCPQLTPIEISLDLLLFSLDSWNPKSLEDILKMRDLSFLCILIKQEHNFSSKHNPFLERKSAELMAILGYWLDRFDSKALSFSEFQKVLSMCGDSKLCALSDIAPRPFPSREDLCEIVVDIEEAQRSLRSRMTVSYADLNRDGSPSGKIIVGINEIIQHYSLVHERPEILGTVLEVCWGAYKRLPYEQVINARRYTIEQFEKKHRLLAIAAFFTQNECTLFESMVNAKLMGNKTSLEKFLDCIASIEQRIARYANNDESFLLTKKDLERYSSSGRSMIADVEVLLQCSGLGLGESARVCLETASTVLCITEPLQTFISASNQYKMGYVEGDPNFQRLEKMDQTLRGIDMGTSQQTIIEEGALLASILSGKDLHETLSCKTNLLLKLPILELYNALSNCSDLWAFVVEKGWIGEDGLQKFCEEYNNITNVSLSDESFKMAVLDSLDFAVRCVSMMASERVLGCNELHDVFDFLGSNEMIQSAWAASTGDQRAFDDLHVVQESIMSIRDWFEEGMDDMLALHNRFNSILLNGHYEFDSRQAYPTLTLRYTMPGRDEREVVLNHREINDFLRKLCCINQDNGHTVHGLSIFLEESKIINEIYENIRALHNSGVDVDGSVLRCKAAQPSLKEIREVLSNTETRVSQCRLSLSKIRTSYPVSLLFWSGELRAVYLALTQLNFAKRGTTRSFADLRAVARRLGRMSTEGTHDIDGTLDAALLSTTLTDSGNSWLEVASHFVQTLSGGSIKPNADGAFNVKCSAIHTLSVEPALRRRCLILLLRKIYKVSGELLGGTVKENRNSHISFVIVFFFCRIASPNHTKSWTAMAV